MQIVCEGCGAAVAGETDDEVLAAMMGHGEQAHPELFEGKSAEEVAAMRPYMEAHVRQMIAAANG